MDVAHAFSLISRALTTSEAGRGYLLCGDLRGSCDELVDQILTHLFPDAEVQIRARTHPDLAILEPEGRSRTIHIKSMRERIVEPMAATAYSGGWKVGIIVSADRMELAAANAFLKTLEEPPLRTLFLLLSDAPDAILPTILSRTQRIDLPLSEGLLEGDDYAAVAEVFESSIGNGVFEKARAGSRLAEILGELKEAADDADVALVRKSFYKTIMSFVRRWMVEERVPRFAAFRNVEAVEDAFRQSGRSMSDEPVLCGMMDRLTFP